MRENLESLIKKCGLEENVFLLGHQDNVFSYLNAADCFVLSSMHEGLPNVVLEAKAVGLPISSVDCDTGPREILAPELSYNESISYPYQTGRHVIVEPLSGDQIFENTETKPLDSAERSLASAMNKKIKKGFEENEFEYDDRFDPQRVINQWVELIK
jgi:glycosyltransferase involved in cell wall biosynthesis